jgi:phosphotriesterase-related protein
VDQIQTVTGPIPGERLGVTMTHEHLLADLSIVQKVPADAGRRAKYYAPVTMDLLGSLNYDALPNLDNLRLIDVETAISEALLYKRAGGDTIVEATSRGIARDPAGLREIARATGLNIVMGTSYYLDATHPEDMDEKSEDDIVAEIVADIVDGVDQTGIRSGVIGEIGCSWPLTRNERKVLRASGRAHRRTGAPLLVHTGRDPRSPAEILDVLREVGADVSRTIMSHIDRTLFEPAELTKLAETGCVIEFDGFGRENSFYKYAAHIDLPNDAQRMRLIAWLISEGYERQIVISHDTGNKAHLVRYGGCGYRHILRNIVPRMRARGFTEAHIQAMLVDTPRRVLALGPQAGDGEAGMRTRAGQTRRTALNR